MEIKIDFKNRKDPEKTPVTQRECNEQVENTGSLMPCIVVPRFIEKI